MKKIIFLLGIYYLLIPANLMGQEKVKTDTLNFIFEGKKLSGFIDIPVNKDTSAI
jgi:hypothetical protein